MGAVLSWIGANIGTIIICAILVALFALLIIWMIRDKKKAAAKGGCTGCCATCSMCSHGGAYPTPKTEKPSADKKE